VSNYKETGSYVNYSLLFVLWPIIQYLLMGHIHLLESKVDVPLSF
jgi:hypothetical protein